LYDNCRALSGSFFSPIMPASQRLASAIDAVPGNALLQHFTYEY
jgi:hypothetical protein